MNLIDKDELREAFDGTDWYHLHNGKMVQGANSALHIPYFRAEDVYKIIYCATTIVEFEGDINKVIVKGEEYHKIVRCKDCKYMTEHYDTDGNVPYWTCSEWDSGTDYDGFCHYAERRSDGID